MEDIAKKLIVKGAKVAIEKGVEYYKERQAAISKAQGMKDEELIEIIKDENLQYLGVYKDELEKRREEKIRAEAPVMSDENLILALTECIANEETPKKFIKIYDDELKERRRQRVTSDALDMEEPELIAAIADALTNEQDTRRVLYESKLQKRRDIRSKVPNMTNCLTLSKMKAHRLNTAQFIKPNLINGFYNVKNFLKLFPRTNTNYFCRAIIAVKMLERGKNSMNTLKNLIHCDDESEIVIIFLPNAF